MFCCLVCFTTQKGDAVEIAFLGDIHVKSTTPKICIFEKDIKSIKRKHKHTHHHSTYLFVPPLPPLFSWFTDRCLLLGNTASLGPEGSGTVCAINLQFDSVGSVTPWGWPLSCSWGDVCWGLWDELLSVSLCAPVLTLDFLPWEWRCFILRVSFTLWVVSTRSGHVLGWLDGGGFW